MVSILYAWKRVLKYEYLREFVLNEQVETGENNKNNTEIIFLKVQGVRLYTYFN